MRSPWHRDSITVITDNRSYLLCRIFSYFRRDVITHTDSVGRRGRMFEAVCLFVCLFVVWSITHKRKKDPKLFKLDVWNSLGTSYKWCGFWVDRSKVKVRFRVRVNSNIAWVLTLWVPCGLYSSRLVSCCAAVIKRWSRAVILARSVAVWLPLRVPLCDQLSLVICSSSKL